MHEQRALPNRIFSELAQMSIPQHSQQNVDFIQRVLTNQTEELRRDPQTVINRPENTKVCVIVEPRNHPFLELVVRNVMHFAGDGYGWNLHVFCGTQNYDSVKAMFPGWSFAITNIGLANIDADLHNLLLVQPTFWNKIAEETVLVFQTDACLFRPLPERFLQYDFVGAPYLNTHEQTPSGRGFNGGLSLRKRSVMLECIERVTLKDIAQFREQHGKANLPSVTYLNKVAEDVFFNNAMEILGKKLPDYDTAVAFSTEAVYNRDSIGSHAAIVKAFWPFEGLVDIVRHSPLAKYDY
jgi:hypothetical protein